MFLSLRRRVHYVDQSIVYELCILALFGKLVALVVQGVQNQAVLILVHFYDSLVSHASSFLLLPLPHLLEILVDVVTVVAGEFLRTVQQEEQNQ